MIAQSLKYALSKNNAFNHYFKGSLLLISIIGIPVIIGYVTAIIRQQINPDENKSRPPRFAPYVERYVDGLMTMIFVTIPIIIPAVIYFLIPFVMGSLSVESIIGGGGITIILAVIGIIFSIIGLYTLPCFFAIQACRKQYPYTNKIIFTEIAKIYLTSPFYSKTFWGFIGLSIIFLLINQVVSIIPIFIIVTLFLVIIYFTMLGYITGRNLNISINS